MSRLEWDKIGERGFQTGLDRGVLYRPFNFREYKNGVSWSGLISVDTKEDEISPTPLYFDGVKTITLLAPGVFSATLKAFTYPDEFSEFDGYSEFREGMSLDNQPRKPFGLCYRTLLGNDIDGIDLGYQLHLLYNVMAIPDSITRQTTNTNIDPIVFSWTLDGVPQEVRGYSPTMHVVINSVDLEPVILSSLEDILYGTDEDPPELPSIDFLFTYLTTITITDNGDGTWTAEGPDELFAISGDDDEIVTITGTNAVFLTDDVYRVSSS